MFHQPALIPMAIPWSSSATRTSSRGRHSEYRKLSRDRPRASGLSQRNLDGLNHILDLAIPEFRSQGGTCHPWAWASLRYGRVGNYPQHGGHRAQTAFRYDSEGQDAGAGESRQTHARLRNGLYGSKTGPWTTDMFIEAAIRASARALRAC